MKKLFTVLFLLITTSVLAAPPSRVSSYVSGDTILASEVTANEDAIFNYLQGGTDYFKDGSIIGADISSTANIQSNSLNLTAIAQAMAITSGGSFTNAGATTLNGAVTIGDAIGDTLVIDAGAWTLTNATTFTLTGALTFSGTIADLGTVTTADINGGTLDGVQVGGTTATGEILVNNATDDADGLGSQGTSGQFLQSQGTGANPTWATSFGTLSSHTSWSAATTSGNVTLAANKVYLMMFRLTIDSTTDSTVAIAFDGAPVSHSYAIDGYELTTGETDAAATSQVSIPLGTVDAAAGKKIVYGQFYIYTTAVGDFKAHLNGTYGRWGNDTLPSVATLTAMVETTDAISTFSVDTAQNSSGDVYIYEFTLD